ncbi:hypothetical protein DH2020_026058 [Rehmannia glutinosa]|uniref:Amino acid transporter transmembrane domain-containing protein n=1 Tax=Rehmannia glutinosa TaxID=99300 RepID=A0ABR0W241_REHGL
MASITQVQAVFSTNSIKKLTPSLRGSNGRSTFLGTNLSSRGTMQKTRERKQLTVVAAAGDVSADGTVYLIDGAAAVALLETAFPILFSRKDLCPECDGAGFVRKSGSTLRANAARKDELQIVCARVMKQLEEEFGLDRTIEIETDDEENLAERVCHDHEEDTESDGTGPSRRHSHDSLDPDSSSFWPQSYRRSMDMYTSVTPPTVSFLKSSSFLSSADKKSQISATESSLFKPLISSSSLDKEDVPTSTLAVKLSSASELRTSLDELPQSQLCSYTQSVLNAVNALCGIGILSTPYALKEGGWFSILLLFIFGIITCYTGILLKRCLESAPQLQTYPDIGQAAFGLSGRIDNLSATFPNAQMDVAGSHLDSYQICAITSTLVILPTVWLRNLSLLSYVSVGGVVTLVLVVLCLLWVGVTSDVGFHPSGKALDFTNLPITIGIYSFCYGSHSVFPNIYSSMKEPSRFPSVLVISFVTAGLLYAGIAVCGFLMFGESTNPQFTLNLPTNLVASDIAAWSVVAAPVTKFGLTITPVALAIEELLPAAQFCLKCLASIFTLALTHFYDEQSVVLPCACYLRIDKGRLTKLEKLKTLIAKELNDIILQESHQKPVKLSKFPVTIIWVHILI